MTFFILPPSREELFRRLLNREQTDNKIANERMKQFDEDILHWRDYDFVVINDNLNNCFNQIIKLIGLKLKNRKIENYNINLVKNHIKNLLN